MYESYLFTTEEVRHRAYEALYHLPTECNTIISKKQIRYTTVVVNLYQLFPDGDVAVLADGNRLDRGTLNFSLGREEFKRFTNEPGQV